MIRGFRGVNYKESDRMNRIKSLKIYHKKKEWIDNRKWQRFTGLKNIIILSNMYIYIYVYTHMHNTIHVYIYI